VAATDAYCVLSPVLLVTTVMQQFMAMAPSPEAFLTVRAEFARSLAVFNISSYMVGIGDRCVLTVSFIMPNKYMYKYNIAS
jgi:Phosphatidylinositol 3- and 4-kinase